MKKVGCVFFLTMIVSSLAHAEANASSSQAKAAESFTAEDWQGVIQTYESQISDGGATPAALHNLALARFKHHEPEQAIAIWLGARERDPRDPEILAGLTGALQSLGFQTDSLDLAAQGPWIAFVSSQGRGSFDFFLKLATAALAVGLILIVLVWLNVLPRSAQKSTRQILSGAIASCLVVMWMGVGIWFKSMGHWGAVTEANGGELRAAPEAKANSLAHIKGGTPIYVLGDTYGSWVYALTADGTSGWINALSVRIVR